MVGAKGIKHQPRNHGRRGRMLAITLPRDMYDRVKREAVERRVSMSMVIVEAINSSGQRYLLHL